MNLDDKQSLILAAAEAAFDASKEILDVYNSDFSVEHKSDRTPLTEADRRAHRAIIKRLEPMGIPILSEEGRHDAYEVRKDREVFWMVDPLDGTKEFVKRNGEFTVNIALIEKGEATAGVIHVPVKEVLYISFGEGDAYKLNGWTEKPLSPAALRAEGLKLPLPASQRPYTVVGSRSHKSAETEEFINELRKTHGEIEMVSMGSSLKICLVAEGTADIYPRFAPTMEWDTAAGHAIARGAGKEIIDFKTKQPMRYNKENLLNNWFIVQ
jgi:3'(2'), 5'-bisphosphate nucleotidase